MGNPNRKNKLRKIVVEGQIYFWVVSSPNCDGDGGCSFRILKDKVEIYGDVTYDTITPKKVREKIIEIDASLHSA